MTKKAKVNWASHIEKVFGAVMDDESVVDRLARCNRMSCQRTSNSMRRFEFIRLIVNTEMKHAIVVCQFCSIVTHMRYVAAKPDMLVFVATTRSLPRCDSLDARHVQRMLREV
jgi:hypothetical protein